MSPDSSENWSLDQFDYADSKNYIGQALRLELLMLICHFTTNFFGKKRFFDKKCERNKFSIELNLLI